jgi:hypothetical protein
MFTSFSSVKPAAKQETGQAHLGRVQLLAGAVNGALVENTHRVYIEDSPYLVEFKLPSNFSLESLQNAIQKNELKSSESTVIGDILVHRFLITGKSDVIEVLYKPFSIPRL